MNWARKEESRRVNSFTQSTAIAKLISIIYQVLECNKENTIKYDHARIFLAGVNYRATLIFQVMSNEGSPNRRKQTYYIHNNMLK